MEFSEKYSENLRNNPKRSGEKKLCFKIYHKEKKKWKNDLETGMLRLKDRNLLKYEYKNYYNTKVIIES